MNGDHHGLIEYDLQIGWVDPKHEVGLGRDLGWCLQRLEINSFVQVDACAHGGQWVFQARGTVEQNTSFIG